MTFVHTEVFKVRTACHISVPTSFYTHTYCTYVYVAGMKILMCKISQECLEGALSRDGKAAPTMPVVPVGPDQIHAQPHPHTLHIHAHPPPHPMHIHALHHTHPLHMHDMLTHTHCTYICTCSPTPTAHTCSPSHTPTACT